MTLTRGFVRNAAKTPLDARLADMATIVCNADGSPRTGVLGNANASIVATTGTMNVTVAAAEFVASKGKADGVTIFTNDGTVNVAISAAPGANSRIDVIWVKHEDNTTGDAASLPIFGVTAGTAAASPTAPAIPTGALELAQLRIYAGTVATNGGSNVLTNTYQMTASRGGVVPFRTKADLDLWTNPVVGQRAYVTATEVDYKRLTNGGTPRWEKLTDSWNARKGASTSPVGSTMTSAVQITITNAPAGRYVIYGYPVTWASVSAAHFRQLKWGATVLPGATDGITVPSQDTPYPIVGQVDHVGGTVIVDLSCQINTATCSINQATTLEVIYLGEV